MSKSGESTDRSRRDALKKMAVGAGAMTAFPILGQAGVTPAMARAAAHMHGAQQAAAAAGVQPDPNWKPLFFDPHQNETVIALTELIIPQTDTPGAKAALVNRFIDLMLNDEDADKRKSFIQGLAWLDGRSLKTHGKPFADLSAQQQTELLTLFADPGNKSPEDEPGVRFFDDIKGWTIYGYYTSQPGMVQELHYGGGDYHEEFPGACTHPEHQT